MGEMNLSLPCKLDIQGKLTSRKLCMWILGLEERSGLELNIWECWIQEIVLQVTYIFDEIDKTEEIIKRLRVDRDKDKRLSTKPLE